MQRPVDEIPLPFTFNPTKHHKNQVLSVVFNKNLGEINFLEYLNSIGNNYIDIYTGEYLPLTICGLIKNQLVSEHIYKKAVFQKWVNVYMDYQTIQLDDGSLWIIREGESTERYIHIHPAKTGNNTIRFKATTLKTIYCLLRENKCSNPPCLDEINEARKKIGLSPIKQLKHDSGILKCWGRFC